MEKHPTEPIHLGSNFFRSLRLSNIKFSESKEQVIINLKNFQENSITHMK